MKTIGVVGASGRTGSKVVTALLADEQVNLGAAIVSSDSKVLGKQVPGSSPPVYYSDKLESLNGVDGVIDFSTPYSSLLTARHCEQNNIPVLIAVTGHTFEQLAVIEEVSKNIPCALVSNTSIGAIVLASVSKQAQEMLGDTFDVEVLEVHHNMKKDAPSGTAKTIVAGLLAEDSELIFNRTEKRAKNEIGVVAVRGGDIPGDHTVFFLGQGERLELTHRVHDRNVFALGAVKLTLCLLEKKAGLYQASELL